MQCQQGKCRHHYEGQGYYNYPLLNYATFNGNFTLAVLEGGKAGADLGGRVQGCAPLPPEMTCGFLIQLVFCKKLCRLLVLKKSKRRVHPLLKKILDPPLKSTLEPPLTTTVNLNVLY